MIFYDKLKAWAAATAAAAVAYVTMKFGFDLGPEMEAAVTGAIVWAMAYLVPNLRADGSAIEQK